MEHRWYAIQTTSGHENKVRGLIDRRIQDDPAEEEARLIRQALVPTEQAAEIKNGKKVTVERKKYPGYVLVEMVLNQDTIHRINGIQGVIKFVGQGWTPQPLRSDEVNRLLGIKEEGDDREPEEDIPVIVGQVVERREGATAGSRGWRRPEAESLALWFDDEVGRLDGAKAPGGLRRLKTSDWGPASLMDDAARREAV